MIKNIFTKIIKENQRMKNIKLDSDQRILLHHIITKAVKLGNIKTAPKDKLKHTVKILYNRSKLNEPIQIFEKILGINLTNKLDIDKLLNEQKK